VFLSKSPIADRGSLTQTAEQLEMSVAMVSRRPAAIEGGFGAPRSAEPF